MHRKSNPVFHDVFAPLSDGRKLFVRVWTPADDVNLPMPEAPIVLFHDSLGCVELWREFPAALCACTGRRVIAYDRLGFGKSDARDDRLQPVSFIADEAKTDFPAIREHLDFRKFIAFGHSVGGGMAVHCAAEFPADCLALITESAQAFAEELTLASIRAAKEQFKDDQQVERLRRYHGAKAQWVLHAWTESWLAPEFASWSLATILPQVTCPVLALHGEFDEYGSARHPQMIGGLCQGPSQVEILEGLHHVPHREQQERILKLVAGFIASLRNA